MLLELLLHRKMKFFNIKIYSLILWGQEEQSCSSKSSGKVISTLFSQVELYLGGKDWISFYVSYSSIKSSIPKP